MVPPADDAEDGDGARALRVKLVRLFSLVVVIHFARLFSLGTDDYLTITIARADGEDIEDEENKWKELGLQNAG